MSWFSKKSNSGSSYPADVAKLQAKQIEELLKYLPSATQYTKTPTVTVYQMSVFTKFGPLKMHIIMPAKFPTEAPQLKVLTQVQHAWVNPDMTVNSAKLREWGPHSNLGKTVQEVFHEFSRNPPGPIAVAQATPIVAQATPLVAQAQPAQPPPLPQEPPPPPLPEEEEMQAFPEPAVPTSFPELDSLTLAELQKLVNDSDALNEIVEKQCSSTSMQTIRKDLCDSIENQAKKNLSKQGMLEEYEAKTQVLLAEIRETKMVVDGLVARKKTIDDRYSVTSVSAILAKKLEEYDERSDELVEQYEDQDDDSDDSSDDDDDDDEPKKKKLTHKKFYKQYVTLRSKFHTCMAKRERLLDVYR